MEIKKVYFFYIIDRDVDVYERDVDVYKDFDPYSGSDDPDLSVSGVDVIHKSENYSTVEDALNAQDNLRDEKHYEYSPVMEGWIRE